MSALVPPSISSFVSQHNGIAASADTLSPLAFSGYAHFTAMQVRNGQVKALDLHLQRLSSASLSLFGRALDDQQVQSALRQAAAASPADISLMATIYTRESEFNATAPAYLPDLLVRTAPPSSGPTGPLRLAVFEHERMLAHIKHVGEIAKTWFMRQAAAQGFDDAAFVDRSGQFSEASIWNLVFWDGESVVWPQAPMLTGTTMGLVMRQLDRMGVTQQQRRITPADLQLLRGAAVMNSWSPGIEVRALGETSLPAAPEFIALLHQAYAAEPWTTL